ncbi:hypothetical protein E2C01_038272 [Portunus trituberculatus]|uniref:Uncharacterized protein n=1 Tax=Portunus trituberculatus TaxID=210409 RepID=A0A5B7FGD7_PORTR|nr:hypothetical protein [Portunus trituberculatus]
MKPRLGGAPIAPRSLECWLHARPLALSSPPSHDTAPPVMPLLGPERGAAIQSAKRDSLHLTPPPMNRPRPPSLRPAAVPMQPTLATHQPSAPVLSRNNLHRTSLLFHS